MYDVKAAFSWNVLDLMKQQNKSWGDIADCYEVDVPTAKEFIFRRCGSLKVETLQKFGKLFGIRQLDMFYTVKDYPYDDIDTAFVEKVKNEYSKEEYRLIMKSSKKTIFYEMYKAYLKDNSRPVDERERFKKSNPIVFRFRGE